MITAAEFTDPLLFVYILSLTYLVIKRREDGFIHETGTKFALILIPYILGISAISASAAANYKVYPNLIAIFVSLVLLVISLNKFEGFKAYFVEFATGLTSLILIWSNISPSLNLYVLIELFLMAAIILIPLTVSNKLFNLFSSLSLFSIFAHFLDASSTVIALERGLHESKTFARLFIEHLGPYGIFLMKSLVIIPLVYFMENKMEERLSEEALFMIGIYGVVLGFRNYFLIFL